MLTRCHIARLPGNRPEEAPLLDRIAVLATEAGNEANHVSTYVAWALCIAALIGIGIAMWRWL